MKKKVLVRGPALSRSGYGVHARTILRALRAHEEYFDIFLQNINWGKTGFTHEDNEEKNWLDHLAAKTAHYVQEGGSFDVSLQVTIPPEWERLAPINIGVTAGIETTKIAPQWVEKCQLVDKIIVVSEHAKAGFDNTEYKVKHPQTQEEINFKNEKPIEVVHYPVREVEAKNLDLDLQTDFNFLVVAQVGPRKNVENTIRGFIEEFKDDENVGLVLKVTKINNCISDRMMMEAALGAVSREIPDRKCKVYLLHGHMTEEEMTGLYRHPKIKALVTLAHGEGYGLPIFEAAHNELPVISPAWGGQCDFLYMPMKNKKTGKIKNKPAFTKVAFDINKIQPAAVWKGVLEEDSMWCFPRKVSYETALREMYKNYDPKKSEAKKLAKHIKKNFTEEKIYEQVLKVIIPDGEREMMKEIESMFEELDV